MIYHICYIIVLGLITVNSEFLPLSSNYNFNNINLDFTFFNCCNLTGIIPNNNLFNIPDSIINFKHNQTFKNCNNISAEITHINIPEDWK